MPIIKHSNIEKKYGEEPVLTITPTPTSTPEPTPMTSVPELTGYTQLVAVPPAKSVQISEPEIIEDDDFEEKDEEIPKLSPKPAAKPAAKPVERPQQL